MTPMPASPAKSLPVLLFFTTVAVAVCLVVGVALMEGALAIWQHGELVLKGSRAVPRVVTQQGNGVEFMLRFALLASLALSFLSLAVVVALVVAHRVHTRRLVEATENYVWPRFAMRACLFPAACFTTWFGLRIVVPLAFP